MVIKKRTPEEIAQAKKEGQELIKEREKRKSQLMAQGQTEVGAGRQFSREYESGEQQRQEQQTEEQRIGEGAEFLKQKEFEFGEGRPERQELDIQKESGVAGAIQSIPFVGAPFTAAGEALRDQVLSIIAPKTLEEEKLLIQDPQTMREIAQQQIQKKEIKKGTSLSEKLGALVEAIPIAGKGLAYLGVIEDPESNVNTIVGELAEIEGQAANMREKAATGKMGDPRVAFEQIEDFEDEVIRLEQRIKILAIQSSELRADADTLNLIESKVLDTKRRLFDAKQGAAMGITAPASDSNVFLSLKELQ